LEPAQPTAGIGGPRLEDERRLDATGDGYVRAHSTADRAQAEDVARLHRQALPRRRRRPVEPDRHVGAGDRDEPLVVERKTRTQQRALEPGRVVVVADQAIGEDEGLAVYRSRRGNADPEVTEPPQVLDGGEWPAVLDEQVGHARSIRGVNRPASTSAAIASHSAPRARAA